MKGIRRVVVSVVAAMSLVAADAAAVDAFLKMGDIKGESTDAAHGDWSDVIGWNWGMGQDRDGRTGTGRGWGRVEFGELVVAKNVDSASPALMLKCAEGSRIREARLDVTRAGEREVMIRFILYNVQVTSVHVEQTADGGEPSETVSLNYTEVKVIYESDGGPIEFSWDVQRNRVP